jgi:hypothetical protein
MLSGVSAIVSSLQNSYSLKTDGISVKFESPDYLIIFYLFLILVYFCVPEEALQLYLLPFCICFNCLVSDKPSI